MIQIQGHPLESLYREVLTKYADVVSPLKEYRLLLASALLDNWEFVQTVPIPEGVDEVRRKEDLQRMSVWMRDTILEFCQRTILPNIISIQPAILRQNHIKSDFLYRRVEIKEGSADTVPEITLLDTHHTLSLLLRKMRIRHLLTRAPGEVAQQLIEDFEAYFFYIMRDNGVVIELPLYDKPPPVAQDWFEHNVRAFPAMLFAGCSEVLKKTRTVYPDTLLCGKNVIAFVEHLPDFLLEKTERSTRGILSLGNKTFTVYALDGVHDDSFILLAAENNERLLAHNFIWAPGYLLDISMPHINTDFTCCQGTFSFYGCSALCKAFAYGTIIAGVQA